jgi:hypothetical protein
VHIKRIITLCGLFWTLCSCGALSVDLRIMIPLYVYPSWYSPASYVWDDVAAAGSKVPVTAIINPNSGPNGGPPNTDYAHGLNDLRNGGVTLLGYVATGYGTRSIADVKADIDLYDAHYNINGIFLDEADNTTNHLAYYTDLYAYIKGRTNLNSVVINPGIETVEDYISTPASDTAVIFEVNNGWPAYMPDRYVTNYPPERFCALLYNVTNETVMRQYVDMAVQRNIGYIYVTNDKGSNPWDTIPSYWTNLVNYVETYRNLSITMPSTGELRLRTLPERSWQVQYTSNLLGGIWHSLTGGVAAAEQISVTDSLTGTATARFYRLRIFQ